MLKCPLHALRYLTSSQKCVELKWIRILPNHACATAAKHQQYQVMERMAHRQHGMGNRQVKEPACMDYPLQFNLDPGE
ncbi:hypothetical protein [Klebsiella aerogenes]|uniref:hypothetical protein n=1 Tax=Klebsiella aerogenes TaxID=548 RepID=UPI00355BFE47